jgi:hypothetical protein
MRGENELRSWKGFQQVAHHMLLPGRVQMQINFVDHHNRPGLQRIVQVSEGNRGEPGRL